MRALKNLLLVIVPRKKGRITQAVAERYIERDLRDGKGLFQGDYTLERLTQGTNPGIYRLGWAGAPEMAIRFHRAGREEETEHFFRIHEMLGGLGFPIPKIVFVDRSRETLRAYGAEVSIEEFVEGEPFRGERMEDEGIVRGLARLMARFHEIKGNAPGMPWRPEARSGYGILMERVDRNLEKALETRIMEWGEAGEIRRWFAEWREWLEGVGEYCLVHGDLNFNNVIIAPGPRITVIDFVKTHFGFFELDLAVSARSLVGDSARAKEVFFEEYFAAAGEAARARFERNRRFFEVFFALEKVSAYAAKAAKVERGEKRAHRQYAKSGQRLLNQFRELIRSLPQSNKC